MFSVLDTTMRSVGLNKDVLAIQGYASRNNGLSMATAIGYGSTRVHVASDCCSALLDPVVFAHCEQRRVRVIRHGESPETDQGVIIGYGVAIDGSTGALIKTDNEGDFIPGERVY